MNTPGKGFFTKGHQLSVGHGRPRKHIIISNLEKLREEVSAMPDQLLTAISTRDKTLLKQFSIPMSQVKELHRVIATGLLSMRGMHE